MPSVYFLNLFVGGRSEYEKYSHDGDIIEKREQAKENILLHCK